MSVMAGGAISPPALHCGATWHERRQTYIPRSKSSHWKSLRMSSPTPSNMFITTPPISSSQMSYSGVRHSSAPRVLRAHPPAPHNRAVGFIFKTVRCPAPANGSPTSPGHSPHPRRYNTFRPFSIPTVAFFYRFSTTAARDPRSWTASLTH